jgi:hypothetical protein
LDEKEIRVNFYTKLALGVLGVGLLAGVWYADEHYTKKEEEQKKTAGKALNFETEKVRKVTAKTDSGTLVFERKDALASWSFEEPKGTTKPDADAVNNLLSALQSLNVETDLAGSEAAAKTGSKEGENFGFGKPKGTFALTLEGGKELSLVVGSEVSVGSTSGSTFNALSLYATSPSRDKVLVVGSSISSTLKKTFADYRSKAVGDFTTADVKSLVVKKGADFVVDMTKNDSTWKITAPHEYNADMNNIGLYFDKIQKLRVDAVTEMSALNPEKLASMGLAVPTASISLLGADKKVIQNISVGMTKEKMFLTLADGAVGSVEIGKFSDLIPETKYFRDRRVMRDISMADAVKLTTPSGRRFHKEGEKWYFNSGAEVATKQPDVKSTTTAAALASPTPSNAKASDKDAETVFSQWEFIVADDILDNPTGSLKEFGLDKPIQKLSFEFRDNKPAPVEILVGNRVPKNEKLVYVKRGDKAEIFAVETQWLEALGRMNGQTGTSPQAHK